MENLTHTLTGLAVSQTSVGRKTPGGPLLLAIAANAPDLEILSGNPTSLHYFYYHRGITHSLPGAVGLALCFSLVAWGWGRTRGREASWLACFWSSLAALLSHLVLDYVNSYGLRPWLPFSGRWVYGDLVFIVDPVFWAVLGLGVYFATGAKGPWKWVWVALAPIFTLACAAGGYLGGGFLWFVWAAVLGFATWGYRRVRSSSRALAWAVIVLVAYVGLLGVSRRLTQERAERLAEQEPRLLRLNPPEVLPSLGNPWTWQVFWKGQDEIGVASLTPWDRGRPEIRYYRRNLRDPLVRKVLESCPGRVTAYFSRFSVYDVVSDQGRPEVVWRDLRFNLGGDSGFGMYRFDPAAPDPAGAVFPCPAVE
ncbi:MAG: hypothetical protein Kow00109_05330 [Acidobacteriota bacterium]